MPTSAVSDPIYGILSGSEATNLKGRWVQLFRPLLPSPHFDGASSGTTELPRADSYSSACR